MDNSKMIIGGNEENNKPVIMGGFAPIYIDEITKNSKDIIWVDSFTKQSEKHYIKASYLKPITSDEQIKTIIQYGDINDFARLLRLLGKRVRKFGRQKINYLHSLLLKAKNDKEVYEELCKTYSRDENIRGEKQAENLFKPLRNYIGITGPKYLDIGCGNGTITVGLKNLLGASEAHGIEIDKTLSNKEVKYHYLEENNYKLPFEDNYFDIITAFMTLHHIKEPELMLAEIGRVLKPGGILYIKEHDSWTSFDAMLVDIEHAFFIYCNNGSNIDSLNNELKNYVCHYKNYWGWIKLITNNFQFKLITADYFYTTAKNEISPTRAWWGIFGKK